MEIIEHDFSTSFIWCYLHTKFVSSICLSWVVPPGPGRVRKSPVLIGLIRAINIYYLLSGFAINQNLFFSTFCSYNERSIGRFISTNPNSLDTYKYYNYSTLLQYKYLYSTPLTKHLSNIFELRYWNCLWNNFFENFISYCCCKFVIFFVFIYQMLQESRRRFC